MKTKYIFLSVLIFLFVSFAYSQDETSIQDILSKATKRVEALENQDQEVVNMTIELLVGTAKGKTIYRNLDNTFKYTIVGIPDKRIGKISIVVYKKVKGEWEFVTEVSEAFPTLTIQPVDYDMYEITVKCDEFNEGYRGGHLAVLIYHPKPQ
jgi:hypothetical protein